MANAPVEGSKGVAPRTLRKEAGSNCCPCGPPVFEAGSSSTPESPSEAEGSRIERPGMSQPPVFKAGCAPCTVPSSCGERRNRTAVPEDSTCFPDKLTALVGVLRRWYPRRDSNSHCAGFEAALSAVGVLGHALSPPRDSNSDCAGSKPAASAVGLGGDGAHGEIRTRTNNALDVVPLPSWGTRAAFTCTRSARSTSSGIGESNPAVSLIRRKRSTGPSCPVRTDGVEPSPAVYKTARHDRCPMRTAPVSGEDRRVG